MKFKYHEKSHTYYVDGKRCKGISSLGKTLEDGTALEQWKLRMVMLGMTMSPDLVESVAHHFDDRQKMKEHIEEALAIAKANAAAQRGTTKHKILDRFDKGEQVIETELAKETIRLWQEALDAAEFEVIPEYAERFVVHPDRHIAGRLDRIMRRKSDGALVVVDLKTGERAIEYPHSVAVQLAFYAHAPLLVGPLNRDGMTEQFEEMPEVDYSTGYVIHMPSDGTARAVPINIGAAWDVCEAHLDGIFAWRARKDLVLREAPVPGDLPIRNPDNRPADPADVERAVNAGKVLDPLQRQTLQAWQRDSGIAFRPWTVRTAAIANAMVTLATDIDGDEGVIRHMIAIILGYEPPTGDTTPALFAALTADEARRLEALSRALQGNDGVMLTYQTDGHPEIIGGVEQYRPTAA